MKRKYIILMIVIASLGVCNINSQSQTQEIEDKVNPLLKKKMMLEEKIGQMNQLNSEELSDDLLRKLKKGEVGSIINCVDPDIVNRM